MVQFSFRSPNSDYLGFPATPKGMVETACKAEELGYDTVVVNDHTLVDDSPSRIQWRNCYDSLTVLSYIAALTTRIRLGPSVLIMPHRNPMVTAKMIATLDQLSGGRIVAGVGMGGTEAEYAAMGVPFRERGARTTEYLRVWQACWAPGVTSFQGKFFTFDNMYSEPKPRQQPHPPIWVGGSSHAALRRAASFAEVWQPTPTPLADLIKNQAYLAEASAKIGRREPPPTRMSFRVNFSHITGTKTSGAERRMGQGTPAQVAEDMRRYRKEAGLEAFQVNFNGCHSLQQLQNSMELFMSEVRPMVEQ